mgnify:CR=1 FL=1
MEQPGYEKRGYLHEDFHLFHLCDAMREPPTGSCRFRQDIPFISKNSILQDFVAVKQKFTYFGIF